MTKYTAPYYTLAETQEILNLRASELQHAIQQGKINPTVHTKPRKLLLLTPTKSGWIGNGTCTYQGNLEIHSSYTKELISNTDITLGTGTAKILEPANISNFSSEYPFKYEGIHEPLTKWQPIAAQNLSQHSKMATLMPEESETILNTLFKSSGSSKAMQTILGDAASKAGKDPKAAKPYSLNFNYNSKFSFNDLRIPLTEIQNFKSSQLALNPTVSEQSNTRENQLHSLIRRILAQNPKISAKAAWRLIEEDAERDEPVFDTEGILQIVDTDGIEWKSRKGIIQHLKQTSFPSILSAVKKTL